MLTLTRLINVRLLAASALLLLVSAVAYGFAAANTVPVSGAGDGSGDISGYTVTNVQYTLSAANPANIASVSLTLTPDNGQADPTDVRVKMTAASTSFITCTGSGANWSCAVPAAAPQTVLGADELTVIAVQ